MQDRQQSGPLTAPAPKSLSATIVRWGLLVVVVALIPGARAASIGFDRFALPQELALELAALAALVAAAVREPAAVTASDVVDRWLLGLLALAGLSAVLAVNHWLAARALGQLAAVVVVFRFARALPFAQVTQVATVASFLLAGSALLEAFGLFPALSMMGRAPGGLSGNRNFMSHFLVLALPTVVAGGLGARRRAGFATACLAVAAASAAILLSRSRASYLATLLLVPAALLPLVLRRRPLCTLPRHSPAFGARKLCWRRGVILAVAALLGVGAVAVVPSRLAWKETAPYRGTFSRLFEHERGTGRGRVIQYLHTLELVHRHPLLGVGPGNWSVAYPEVASENDPSYTPASIQPVNRLANSDWLGATAELGLVAMLMAGAAVFALVSEDRRRLAPDRSDDEAAQAVTTLCTLVALLVVGALDCVLLRAPPAYLCALVLGSLHPQKGAQGPSSLAVQRLLAVGAGVAMLAFVGHRGVEIAAHLTWINEPNAQGLARAARINPGDYQLAARMAWVLAGQGQCDEASRHAQRALRLSPSHLLARQVLERCGGGAPSR
jgi:hypothetical protein